MERDDHTLTIHPGNSPGDPPGDAPRTITTSESPFAPGASTDSLLGAYNTLLQGFKSKWKVYRVLTRLTPIRAVRHAEISERVEEILERLQFVREAITDGQLSRAQTELTALAQEYADFTEIVEKVEAQLTPQTVRVCFEKSPPPRLRDIVHLLRHCLMKPDKGAEDYARIDFLATELCVEQRIGGRRVFRPTRKALVLFEEVYTANSPVYGGYFEDFPVTDVRLAVAEFESYIDFLGRVPALDQLLDSGLIKKAREFKKGLGELLCQQEVLFWSATYNATLCEVLDTLFLAELSKITASWRSLAARSAIMSEQDVPLAALGRKVIMGTQHLIAQLSGIERDG